MIPYGLRPDSYGVFVAEGSRWTTTASPSDALDIEYPRLSLNQGKICFLLWLYDNCCRLIVNQIFPRDI